MEEPTKEPTGKSTTLLNIRFPPSERDLWTDSDNQPQIPIQLSEGVRFLYYIAVTELEVYVKMDNPGADPYTQLLSNFCDDVFSFICGVDMLREGRP